MRLHVLVIKSSFIIKKIISATDTIKSKENMGNVSQARYFLLLNFFHEMWSFLNYYIKN